jgi:pimeloyl-ACP methyl ester carboxylesterase
MVAGLFDAAAAAPNAQSPRVRAIDCPPHDLGGTVQCHAVKLAENPARPTGRRIDLEVMVLKARSARPSPDPLVVIPGGPGQSATRSASPRSYFAETFDALRESRDIVLIAPRGTAGANELSLQVPPELLFASLDTVFPPEWARHALEPLRRKADLRQYTTSNIVADIDALRRALGYGIPRLSARSCSRPRCRRVD